MDLLYNNFADNYPEAKSITLKNFTDVIRDYNTYYNCNIAQFHYQDESELNEIMSEMYNAEDGLYTIDYDNEIVAIPRF